MMYPHSSFDHVLGQACICENAKNWNKLQTLIQTQYETIV